MNVERLLRAASRMLDGSTDTARDLAVTELVCETLGIPTSDRTLDAILAMLQDWQYDRILNVAYGYGFMAEPEVIANLIVNDTAPGFMRTRDARELHNFAQRLNFFFGAYHLGHTLEQIADAVLEGRVVTITVSPRRN